jgi:hypothetical protein
MDNFGTILATREMTWEDADGDTHTAYVDIGVPSERQAPDANSESDWECKVRLRNLGDEEVRSAYGVDAVQAIFHALAMAGVLVAANGLADELDWSEVPNFGFPLPPVVPNDGGGCGCGDPPPG